MTLCFIYYLLFINDKHKVPVKLKDRSFSVFESFTVRTCFVTNLERAKAIQQSTLQNDDSKVTVIFPILNINFFAL